MAIPGIPTNFNVQQGNQQVFLSWNISVGSTSYQVQRSTDGVTYTILASSTLNQYLDTTVTIGTCYYYQIASTNVSGTSPYTAPQSVVPTTSGEMSLGELRLRAQQRADRVNSNFVTTTEWNSYINQCMFELYDLLITEYEDYFKAPSASFTVNGSSAIWPLPNGVLSFTDNSGSPFVAAPFYKLLGVDLAVNTASNAYVTVPKFNFIDRNRFVYPNTASTIYGVFNLRYRMMGNNLEFIPTPSGNQIIRIQYIPRMQMLLKDTDVTVQGISGWLEFVIVKAAYLALCKEESDTMNLEKQLQQIIERIQDSAMNRDVGQPDTISDVRANGTWGNTYGWNGPIGGV